MDVREKLALIPRPVVHLVPRRLRDRWRTALLARERKRQVRASLPPAEPSSEEAGATGSAQRLPQVEATLARIESKLDAVVARFEELSTGIEQLDMRVSRDVGGDTPSAVDDLRDIIGPVEALTEQLRARAKAESEIRRATG